MLLGIYKDIHPFNQLSMDRINAYLDEAKKQKIELLFFGLEQVDFEKRTIIGDILNGTQWIKKEVDFPKLMINDFAGKLGNSIDEISEKRLNTEVLQTVNLIQNKLVLTQQLTKTASAPYIIPSKALLHVKTFLEMLDKFNKVVLKPINGRQGEEIFILSKDRKGYKVQDHNRTIYLSKNQLIAFMQFVISKGNYLVQPFIHCRTHEDLPFDFRIHAMKNSSGEWFIFTSRVRVGDRLTSLTNTSRGGQSSDAATFLKSNFEALLLESLEKISIQLAKDIEGIYPYLLDELGIDLAVDHLGKIWFYEANTSPQILTNAILREKERAVHMIGYAKYLLVKMKEHKFAK